MSVQLLDVGEFVEHLRLQGNEFADEIRDALDLRDEIFPVYQAITEELDYQAPERLREKTVPKMDKVARYLRIIEYLADRSNALGELCEKLKIFGRTGDLDDEVDEMLTVLTDAEECLRKHGHLDQDGDFFSALCTLAERPAFDL